MEVYFNPQKISIREISKTIARDMIVKYHYSHKWSLCRIAYGIYYQQDTKHSFFNENEENLIGVVVYGGPVGRSAAASISKLIDISECIELTRLFIHDGFGKNIESYCISHSMNLLKKRFPQLKSVISYADNEAGHRGTIYQASNFIFTGLSSEYNLMPNYSISLTGPPNYKWMHSRTVSEIYGSHNVEHLKRKIKKTFWRKKESGKFRFIYFICDKVEKKKIMKNLKHPILPYQKESIHLDEIEEITIKSTEENPFFG